MKPKWQDLRKRDRILTVLMLGAPLVLVLYWMITETGPYESVVSLQLSAFGSYGPKLTFLLLAIVAMAPVAVISVLYRSLTRDRGSA